MRRVRHAPPASFVIHCATETCQRPSQQFTHLTLERLGGCQTSCAAQGACNLCPGTPGSAPVAVHGNTRTCLPSHNLCNHASLRGLGVGIRGRCILGFCTPNGNASCAPHARYRRRSAKVIRCWVLSTTLIFLNLGERSWSNGHSGEAQYSKRTKMLRQSLQFKSTVHKGNNFPCSMVTTQIGRRSIPNEKRCIRPLILLCLLRTGAGGRNSTPCPDFLLHRFVSASSCFGHENRHQHLGGQKKKSETDGASCCLRASSVVNS